ncbi:TetR/AcrR family transcriptional regulator [Dietzia maris]|uniref:TetR/AcrR family transcriptional regulator n=1 Tax=Dietzia maris TaxID=37915 RepID=UPI00232FA294|nr:TetR/AcrR family transcriptional regulator [Dietzia maris]
MPSLRERKKADTRTRLSAAAVELLVAEGAERATVSAIAGRAGVSTRTFHNYFAHREDAFVHFLREQIAEWVRQVEQAPADMSPLDVLRSTFHELYGRSADDIDAAENLLVAGEQIGLMLGPDARTSIAENILDPLYEAVGRRAPQLNRFRVRVMVDLSLAAGASVLRHRPGGAGPADSAESYLDEAFDLLQHGAARFLERD